MSARYARMTLLYEQVLDFLNYIFAVIFFVECVMKLIGLCLVYFSNSWNRFDFFIVIGTTFGLLFNVLDVGIDISTTVTVIRAFRILRIMRLMKSFGKVVLDTLVNIIPSIINIISLIFLLFFIYSALGMSLFSTVKFGKNYNENYNFRSFFSSLILLMRCSTGEDWNLIMDDLTISINCVNN